MNTDQLHADTRSCGEMSCEECNERTEALRNEIARLTAELAALREEREWRPIATAPKDGSEILGLFRIKPLQIAVTSYWPLHAVWCGTYAPKAPTHWLPLPQPPALAADVREGVSQNTENPVK